MTPFYPDKMPKSSQGRGWLLILIIFLMALPSCTSKEDAGATTAFAHEPVPLIDSPLLAFAQSSLRLEGEKNSAHILNRGDEALLARIHLIQSARKNIAIQTFIWANDEVGRLVMYELLKAARRGVEVRLLIDHIASEQNLETATFLATADPNLHIKLYNPLSASQGSAEITPSILKKLQAYFVRFTHSNQRMHNKVFIADDMVGIAGGRNYQNAYYDQARGLNYKDRDILVIGPIVAEMTRSFQSFWECDYAVDLKELQDVRDNIEQGLVRTWGTRESFKLHGLFEDMDARSSQPGHISQLFVAPLKKVENASFIADKPGKNKEMSFGNFTGSGEITRELAQLVSQAKHSVCIQTPYLILSSAAIDLFAELRRKNPAMDFRISTNSLAATDSWYVYALSYKQKQTYLKKLNFKIAELKPLPGDIYAFMPTYDLLRSRPLTPAEREEMPSFSDQQDHAGSPAPPLLQRPPPPGSPFLCLHAKSLVVDDEVLYIGSYNLDPRSENLNTEVGIVIRDKDLARELKADINRDMAPHNSWIIAKKKLPLGMSEVNALVAKISDILPIVDPWPLRYASSYELIEGKEPVDVSHADFYENYRDVGNFPQMNAVLSGKELGARGTKAFLSFVKPLL